MGRARRRVLAARLLGLHYAPDTHEKRYNQHEAEKIGQFLPDGDHDFIAANITDGNVGVVCGSMPVTVTYSSATPEQIGSEMMRTLRNAQRGGRV